jgi:hypothetical protein
MRIFHAVMKLIKRAFREFTAGMNEGAASDGPGDTGSGPPDNTAPVPRRPVSPRRAASAAQPIPEADEESCELAGARR